MDGPEISRLRSKREFWGTCGGNAWGMKYIYINGREHEGEGAEGKDGGYAAHEGVRWRRVGGVARLGKGGPG